VTGVAGLASNAVAVSTIASSHARHSSTAAR